MTLCLYMKIGYGWMDGWIFSDSKKLFCVGVTIAAFWLSQEREILSLDISIQIFTDEML